MCSGDIRQGDKLTICTDPEGSGGYSYTSGVESVMGKNTFLVLSPIFAGQVVELSAGKEYRFLFYTKSGLVQAKGSAGKHFIKNNVSITTICICEAKRIQRRLFFRMNVLLEFSFTRSDERKKRASGGALPENTGIILDLSGGGMRFHSDVPLTAGEKISCRFCVRETPVFFEGKILSAAKFCGSKETFAYRAEFIGIESRAREKIIQYIFERQNEMIRKKRMEDTK